MIISHELQRIQVGWRPAQESIHSARDRIHRRELLQRVEDVHRGWYMIASYRACLSPTCIHIHQSYLKPIREDLRKGKRYIADHDVPLLFSTLELVYQVSQNLIMNNNITRPPLPLIHMIWYLWCMCVVFRSMQRCLKICRKSWGNGPLLPASEKYLLQWCVCMSTCPPLFPPSSCVHACNRRYWGGGGGGGVLSSSLVYKGANIDISYACIIDSGAHDADIHFVHQKLWYFHRNVQQIITG